MDWDRRFLSVRGAGCANLLSVTSVLLLLRYRSLGLTDNRLDLAALMWAVIDPFTML